MKISSQIILLTFLLFANISLAQNDSLELILDDSTNVVVNTRNPIYDNKIKTVLIHKRGLDQSVPIISLQSSGQLTLSFDDLNNEYREYSFKIIHCDRFWQPTQESENEYFESQRSRYLEESEFSSAISVEYNHYILNFPRKDERFLKSGNFLIEITNTENDSVAFIKRFMVVQGGINVNANISRTDDVQFSDYRQQIKFDIYDPSHIIEDISMLYVVISKNNSWVFQCDKLKPSFVLGDKIQFERTDQCYFEGGNEYRSFNMIDLKNISNNIVKVEFTSHKHFSIWLDDDNPRSFLKYSSMEDLNGDILFTGHNKTFKANELDYVDVHFSLNTEVAMLGYEIYVFGKLSDYQIDETYKMEFNPEKGKYTLDIMLKQGYYNYQYVVKSIYQDKYDEGLIEGSHFETENDYSIFVYYHSPFDGYDQLLSVEQINSRVKLEHIYKK